MNTLQYQDLTRRAQEILQALGLTFVRKYSKSLVIVSTIFDQVIFQLFVGNPAAEEYLEMPPLEIFSEQIQNAYLHVRPAGFKARIAVFRNEEGRNDYYLEVVIISEPAGSAIASLKLLDGHFNRAEVERLLDGRNIVVRLSLEQALALCLALEYLESDTTHEKGSP